MTDVLVKHAFVSPKADGPDTTKIRASNWNAAELFSGGNTGDLVKRDSGSATGASWLPASTFATPADVSAGDAATLASAQAFATAAVAATTLTVNTTQQGTPANLNETDLWVYTLPANTLNANGRALRITVWGTTAANTNLKIFRLYAFGMVVIGSSTSISGETWRFEALVVRTGPSAEESFATFLKATGLAFSSTQPSGNTAANATIKATGQNGTAVANDVLFRGAIVELL